MFRFLTDGPPVPDKTIVSILDDIVLPLLRPPAAVDHAADNQPRDDRRG